MDLVKYLGVEEYINGNGHDQCPILVFIASSYADEVGDDYLSNPSTENIQIWNHESEWKTWIWKNMMQTVRISVDIPFDLEVTVKHQTTNSYLKVIGKPWSEMIKVDAIQSFTELQVFPGTNVMRRHGAGYGTFRHRFNFLMTSGGTDVLQKGPEP